MTAIKYTVDLQVAGGPQVKFNDKLEVDAYDSIEVSINGGDTKTISVQPGATDKVKLLFIRSSVASDKVSFENKDATDQVTLVNPVLLTGDAIALLANAPKDIKFKNGLPDPVTIQIIAGRSAI